MGRRIRKVFGSATTIYTYDGADVIENLDSSGNVIARYTQSEGIDEPLAMYRGLTTSYFHADGLGSITSLTDGSGQLAASYVYDSFGKLTASTGTITNPFQYTGREFDSETGVYYYRARYYDPGIESFISEDPLGFGGGDVNFYAYVRNDPDNLIDPFGLRPGDKYRSRRCAGWNAENDYDPISRQRNLEYGGFIYKNADGSFSYTDPRANNNAGIGTPDGLPNFWNITIPGGTHRAGWYHTHAAFDPSMNMRGNPAPGQHGYNWHNDGNEIMSNPDMDISDQILNGLPGYLGTPRGTIEEYMPVARHPRRGHTTVLNGENCGCH